MSLEWAVAGPCGVSFCYLTRSWLKVKSLGTVCSGTCSAPLWAPSLASCWRNPGRCGQTGSGTGWSLGRRGQATPCNGTDEPVEWSSAAPPETQQSLSFYWDKRHQWGTVFKHWPSSPISFEGLNRIKAVNSSLYYFVAFTRMFPFIY